MTPATILPLPPPPFDPAFERRIQVVAQVVRRVLQLHPELVAEWETLLLGFLVEQPSIGGSQ